MYPLEGSFECPSPYMFQGRKCKQGGHSGEEKGTKNGAFILKAIENESACLWYESISCILLVLSHTLDFLCL
jgi:hypothetical protein